MLSSNNKYIIFVFFVCLLFSCNQVEQNIKYEMTLFLNSSITFPDNLIPLNMRDTLTKFDLLNTNKKLIRYIDSAECLDCCVNEIRLLGDMAKNMNIIDFSAFVIISSSDISAISDYIITNNIKLPILLDVDNRFLEWNTQVPKMNLLKTFLIRNDSVILCGTPIFSTKLKEGYEKRLMH